VPEKIGRRGLGHYTAIWQGDAFEQEQLDFEMGFLLREGDIQDVQLSSSETLTVHETAAFTAATYIAATSLDYSYIAYNALGTWMELNGYHVSGQIREVILEMPDPYHLPGWIREIQIPIEPVS